MMISPETFAEELKNKSYEELLKIRGELIAEILYFKEHIEDQMQNEIIISPSPDISYKMNLEYLGEICKLISEKFNEKYEE